MGIFSNIIGVIKDVREEIIEYRALPVYKKFFKKRIVVNHMKSLRKFVNKYKDSKVLPINDLYDYMIIVFNNTIPVDYPNKHCYKIEEVLYNDEKELKALFKYALDSDFAAVDIFPSSHTVRCEYIHDDKIVSINTIQDVTNIPIFDEPSFSDAQPSSQQKKIEETYGNVIKHDIIDYIEEELSNLDTLLKGKEKGNYILYN